MLIVLMSFLNRNKTRNFLLLSVVVTLLKGGSDTIVQVADDGYAGDITNTLLKYLIMNCTKEIVLKSLGCKAIITLLLNCLFSFVINLFHFSKTQNSSLGNFHCHNFFQFLPTFLSRNASSSFLSFAFFASSFNVPSR